MSSVTLFALREISILGMKSDLNFQIDALVQKQQNLSSVGMIMADGNITAQEFGSSNCFVQSGLDSVYNLAQGMTQQSTMMYGQPIQMTKILPNNQVWLHGLAVENAKAVLASKEKDLEMQIKRLENKMAQLDRELDSVVKGKDKAIEQSTPKYVMA